MTVGVGLSVTVAVGVVRTVDVISVADVVSVVNVVDEVVDVVGGAVDVIDVVAMSTSGTVEATSVVCKVIVTVAVGAKGPRAGVEVPPMAMGSGDKCILLLRWVGGWKKIRGCLKGESREFEVANGSGFVSWVWVGTGRRCIIIGRSKSGGGGFKRVRFQGKE